MPIYVLEKSNFSLCTVGPWIICWFLSYLICAQVIRSVHFLYKFLRSLNFQSEDKGGHFFSGPVQFNWFLRLRLLFFIFFAEGLLSCCVAPSQNFHFHEKHTWKKCRSKWILKAACIEFQKNLQALQQIKHFVGFLRRREWQRQRPPRDGSRWGISDSSRDCVYWVCNERAGRLQCGLSVGEPILIWLRIKPL